MKVTLLEVTGYDTLAGVETTLYFADKAISPFAGSDADRPHRYYEPRITDLGSFSYTMFGSGKTSGRSSSNAGTLSLANADGALDALKDWSFPGRRVRLYRGTVGAAFASYALLLSGTLKHTTFNYQSGSLSTLDLVLADRAAELDKPIQATVYAGSNVGPTGNEGTASDLKNRPKPLCFGACFNVSPAKCNTAALRYQVHDGAINAVLAVYDKGVPLTYSASPGAGQYSTDLSQGLITLGSKPDGDITADVQGAAPGGVYLSRVADVVKHIVTTYGGLSAGDCDSTAFSALNSANSAAIGLFISEARSISQVLDELLASVGGFWTFNRLGILTLGRLQAPAATALLSLSDVDMLELALLPSADDDKGVPVWRVNVDYRPNTTPQNASALAGSVSDSRRSELEQPHRTATASDASVQTVHRLAPQLSRSTLLAQQADAEAEAARLLALYKVRRDCYRVTVPTETLAALALGDTIELRVNRLGLNNGKRVVVLAMHSDTPLPTQTQLEVWG